MKKLRKKNNKGFTLVELIVVVLIMAILAVALAPQVMKWVNNSRISADVSTYDSMVSSIQLALTDEDTYKNVKSATGANAITISITTGGVTFNPAIPSTGTNASSSLDAQLREILGENYKAATKAKVSTANYEIEVDGGTVNKTTNAPNGSTIE